MALGGVPGGLPRCPGCGSKPGEIIARELWPAVLDPERCELCMAVVSYRWPVESALGKLFERRRIAR